MQSAIFNEHGITSISRIHLSNTETLINASGIYTVKTAYNLYMEHFTVSTALTMPGDWNFRCNLKLPPKIKIFLWRLGHDVLLTKHQLPNKVSFVHPCVLVVTTSPLVFKCDVTKSVREKIKYW